MFSHSCAQLVNGIPYTGSCQDPDVAEFGGLRRRSSVTVEILYIVYLVFPGSGCPPQNHRHSIESCKKMYTEYGEPPTTRVWLDDTSGSSSPMYTEYGQVPRQDLFLKKVGEFLCESVEKSEARPLCVRFSSYSVYRISPGSTCVADNNIIHSTNFQIETVPIIHILYTLSSSIFIRTARTSCILVFRIQDPCCELDV